jgi:L-glyceraldehyde 3-phosphate reductase
MNNTDYTALSGRYDGMVYRRCGRSGIQLPVISLGLWHNFGDVDDFGTSKAIIHSAFDLGITHFDLANNYGPPPGTAEVNFGKVLGSGLKNYRDELIISTKAGYYMWPGPYGEWGSRKYLIASCDQSLRRMGIDYVDIFYSHRPDPYTPLEETMSALDHLVKQGKALYVGISNYSPEQTKKASALLKDFGTPCLIHQPKYSMFERTPENGLLEVLEKEGLGCIVFSPLAQGLLTNRYLKGIPQDSRAAKSSSPFLTEKHITTQVLDKIRSLHAIANNRGQSLAQMAIAWLLKDERITSILIGASSAGQLKDNVGSISNLTFNEAELTSIENILNEVMNERSI